MEMENICKDYSGVTVLKNVSLTLDTGEVLALVGENGAGKSTLIKILSGSIPATEGEIYINGEKQHFNSPIDAIKRGISVIYQELNYYKDLTVAENIFAGKLPQTKLKKIDWKRVNERALETLREIEVDINTGMIVGELPVAQKQLIEIAKAISRDNRIIVMDEPTAALNDEETSNLFKMIRRLRDKGISFIYISHRLEELFQVADRVMVLRDGGYVGGMNIKDAKREDIVRMMVGRDITQMYPHKVAQKGEVMFEVRSISGGIVKDVSLKVRKGEIVAIFGLMGSGLTELLEEIFGIRKKDTGEIYIDGKKVDISKAVDAVRYDMAYVPPERKVTGLYMQQSIKDNIVATSIKDFSRGWIMDRKREAAETQAVIEKLSIKCQSMNTVMKSLSGGNQQKVLLGKWIRRNPRIILINEPTRGVDVGTKTEIYRIIEELCEKGFAILMISSELPEVLMLSDKVYVLCNGRITGEFQREELTQELLMEYAIGW